ncbi:hypothetical protein [Actinomadura verrucosospora]
MESIAVIAAKVADLRDRKAPLSEWSEVAPMVNGVSQRLHPHRLEDHLRAELGYLRAVCRAPHARLRTEHVLVPVSKARRMTWRTVVHLAAHSETWEARRLHGVEPAQLLTPVQVADHDLYENRVVGTLLDRLWRHVLARIAEIDAIDSMIRQGHGLLEQAEARPDWRQKQRLYTFIAELLQQDDLSDRIEQRRAELLALRGALAPLRNSELRAGIRGPYTGPPRLRPTNLFDNDVNYRHCRRLWDIEVASRQSSDDHDDLAEALTTWCRDFAYYTLILMLRSLEQFGVVPTTTEGPRIGEPGPRYTYRGHDVRLDWNRDDTFTLLLDDDPALRVVPVPHALTRQPEHLDQHLNALRRNVGAEVAVLYPGELVERERMPPHQRIAVHDAAGTAALPRMVPVSPADLGSMGRLARTLRGVLDERIMLEYPARVPRGVTGDEVLTRRFGWLDHRDGQLLVTRPPLTSEVEPLDAVLAGLRTRADAARRQGDNQEEINRLRAGLVAAVDQVTKLTHCPICSHRPENPAAEFTVRDDDTYRCSCSNSSCSTVWELRRCLSCQARYPVLIVPSSANRPGGHGDLLDDRFSQDLLAVPCWHNARSYICRHCGGCSESSAQTCERCLVRDPPS